MNKRRLRLLHLLRLVIHQKYIRLLYITLGVFLLLCTCSANSGESNAMAKQQKDSILIERFWDTYDFTDTIRLSSSATTERMLVDYLSQLSELTEERACENIRRLVLKTKVNKVVNRWFLQRLEHHLYEPDSSLRNDSYYISVLEEALTSGHLDGMMRIRPLYQLKMLKKNRIGIKAADFTFILSTGEFQKLWDVSAKYTLLLFYDPDCIYCRQSMMELSESSVINSFLQHSGLSLSQLALVTICTEGEMDAWKEYQQSLPSVWINGYDVRKVLTEKELYFLRSLPSIYLLGEDKQVLLKEPSSIGEVTGYLLNKYDDIYPLYLFLHPLQVQSPVSRSDHSHPKFLHLRISPQFLYKIKAPIKLTDSAVLVWADTVHFLSDKLYSIGVSLHKTYPQYRLVPAEASSSFFLSSHKKSLYSHPDKSPVFSGS